MRERTNKKISSGHGRMSHQPEPSVTLAPSVLRALRLAPRALRPSSVLRPSSSVRGFTLIEMLVVIAILGILLGLLFIPLVRSFGFVGREEAEIALQNSTREAMRQVTGEISEAMRVTTFPDNPTRVDLVLPAAAVLNDFGVPMPNTNPVANSAGSPGQMWETFFIGLANPGLPNGVPGFKAEPYNNLVARKVSGGLVNAQNTDENEYVLWRAIYNLNDPKDPVTMAIKAAGGNPTTLESNPWFFDDSLQAALASPGAALPFDTPIVSNANRQLLSDMQHYTARFIDSQGNPHPVAAELTPVVISSHLDAVRSTWNSAANGGQGGWIIDPRIAFLPAASQNELLAPSEFGTQFQTSRGEWVTTGSAVAAPLIYWPNMTSGYQWAYDVTDSAGKLDLLNPTGGAMLDGANGPITILNGPQAVAVVSGTQEVAPAFADPRTGKITFTQFQVTETAPVQSGVSVYNLFYPGVNNTTTYAQLVTANGTDVARIHPQIVPFTDSLQVITTDSSGNKTVTNYQRIAGNLDASDPATDDAAKATLEASSNTPLETPGVYMINYVASPDLSMAPQTPKPYSVDEVPLIKIPITAYDPNIQPFNSGTGQGSVLKVTYRFTFSTLDALGNPLARAAATYASQRFVHVEIGFRNYDESTSTAQDFALATSVGSSNPIDEQPNAE